VSGVEVSKLFALSTVFTVSVVSVGVGVGVGVGMGSGLLLETVKCHTGPSTMASYSSSATTFQ